VRDLRGGGEREKAATTGLKAAPTVMAES